MLLYILCTKDCAKMLGKISLGTIMNWELSLPESPGTAQRFHSCYSPAQLVWLAGWSPGALSPSETPVPKIKWPFPICFQTTGVPAQPPRTPWKLSKSKPGSRGWQVPSDVCHCTGHFIRSISQGVTLVSETKLDSQLWHSSLQCHPSSTPTEPHWLSWTWPIQRMSLAQ